MRAKHIKNTIKMLEMRAMRAFENYGDDRVVWLWLFYAAEMRYELDKVTGGQNVQG